MDSNHLGNSFQIESHTMYISQQNDTYKPSSIIEGQKSVQSNYRNSHQDHPGDLGSSRNSFTNFKSPRGANFRENSSDIKLASPYNPIKQSFPEAYSHLISVLDSLHHLNNEETNDRVEHQTNPETRKSEGKQKSSTRKQFNPYYQGNEGDLSLSCTLRSHQSIKSPSNVESRPKETDQWQKAPSQKYVSLPSSKASKDFLAKFHSFGFQKLQRFYDKQAKLKFFRLLSKRTKAVMSCILLADLILEKMQQTFRLLTDFYPVRTLNPKANYQTYRTDQVLLQKTFRGLREATKRQRSLLQNVRQSTVLEKVFTAWRCLSAARAKRNEYKVNMHNKTRLRTKTFYILKAAAQLTSNNIKELLTLRVRNYWNRLKKVIKESAVDRIKERRVMKFRVATLKRKALKALIKQAAERKWHSKDGYVRLKVTRTFREFYEPTTLKLTSRQKLATVIRPILFDN